MSRMCYRITATSTVTATSKYYSSRRMAVNFSSSRLRSEHTGSQRTLFDPNGGSTERSIPPSSPPTLNCSRIISSGSAVKFDENIICLAIFTFASLFAYSHERTKLSSYQKCGFSFAFQ